MHNVIKDELVYEACNVIWMRYNTYMWKKAALIASWNDETIDDLRLLLWETTNEYQSLSSESQT